MTSPTLENPPRYPALDTRLTPLPAYSPDDNVSFLRSQKIPALASSMSQKYNVLFNASSLSVECAIHTAELQLIQDPIRSALVEKRIAQIKERMNQLHIPNTLFLDAQRVGESLASELSNKTMQPDQRSELFNEIVIAPLAEGISKLNAKTAETVYNGFNDAYKKADPLWYRLGARSSPVASRGGSRRGRGYIDCSHFTYLQKRILLDHFLGKKGMSGKDISNALKELKYIPTSKMLKEAYKPQAFSLNNHANSRDIMNLVKKGKLRDGFEFVFPPRPRSRYGHVVMLRVTPDKSDAWFEESTVAISNSQRNSERSTGVQRFELSRFDSLRSKAGGFRIFIDPVLRKHGVWPELS